MKSRASHVTLLTVLLCGALGSACGSDSQSTEDGPTASLTLDGPSDPVVADWPFEVATSWRIDGSRQLSVALLAAPDCGENLQDGLRSDPDGITLVQPTVVSGTGERVDAATITRRGSYLVCGYLHGGEDPGGRAEVVERAPHRVEITTFAGARRGSQKLRACGRMGGPRRISRVRARRVGCRAARSIARRWAAVAQTPASVGAFTCRDRDGTVTCRAPGRRMVRFRHS
jgi:hypothetical protein